MCAECMYSSECPCGFKGDPHDRRDGRRTECCPKPKGPKSGPTVTRNKNPKEEKNG